MPDNIQKITPLLMFEGKAEEAMNFYISLFRDSCIITLNKYKANDAGIEGSVKHALFALNGQQYRCIDTNVKHSFTFTPSISLYVSCESLMEIETLFNQLSHNGQVLMPLDFYPFSKQFGWVSDKFGVSWQLNLA